MTDLSMMIKKDSIKQMVIGSILLIVAVALVVIQFSIPFNVQLFIMAILVFVVGGSILGSGISDLIVSKNTRLTMNDPDQSHTNAKWPKRMFLEQTINKATLYDMKENSYLSVLDQSAKEPKSPIIRFITLFLEIGSGATALTALMAAKYKITNQTGQTLFYFHKKAGFQWRGYVFDDQGKCIAFLDTRGKEKHLVLQYVDNRGVRWKAYRDVREFITITDSNGNEQVVIKPGGIPVEAADRFARPNGYLLDWSESKQVPYSLLVFLFSVCKK